MEFHAHCICAKMHNLFFNHVINKHMEKVKFFAKFIHTKKKNQFDKFGKTWFSVKLLDIAEASTLLLFNFVLFIETLAFCMPIT